ncbi:hypothetical protein SOVF_155180 [Spinacia oleracea]|nr:hypothetical protein SOVF_155180 [Spinacia oleracea]
MLEEIIALKSQSKELTTRIEAMMQRLAVLQLQIDEVELLAATVAVGFTKTFSILIAIFLIDHLGRKPLLYVSTIGMTVCLVGLGLSFSLTRA